MLWRLNCEQNNSQFKSFALDRIFRKWQPGVIGANLLCDTRARSLYYRFYRFNLVWPPCVLLMIYVKILGMFSLNSIGCVTKCGPAGILEGTQLTDVCKVNVLKSSYRKIWSNILTARWRASAWSDKMNKEQSADDPSVDLIRVKNMLNSTISMSYPDVVIACIEHKVSLPFRAIEAALRSTIIIWRIIPLVVDWSP